MDSYFGLQSVVIVYFDVQIGPDLASGSPSVWLLCPFDMFPSFFEHFLTLGRRCYRFILYFLSSAILPKSPASF